jgi:hypothetical protein
MVSTQDLIDVWNFRLTGVRIEQSNTLDNKTTKRGEQRKGTTTMLTKGTDRLGEVGVLLIGAFQRRNHNLTSDPLSSLINILNDQIEIIERNHTSESAGVTKITFGNLALTRNRKRVIVNYGSYGKSSLKWEPRIVGNKN